MTAGSAQFAAKAETRDDLDLVHATQDGDVSAFEELVDRYDRKLLRIAEHITHNREDSQDAVQEAFLKAFQHMGEFREDSQFSTWLFRITVNQALMKLRKRRTTKEVSLDDDFQADGDIFPRKVADWAPNPEELYRRSELRNILVNALEELRPIMRTVFVLRDIEGLSINQTAEVLDLSPTAVCYGRERDPEVGVYRGNRRGDHAVLAIRDAANVSFSARHRRDERQRRPSPDHHPVLRRFNNQRTECNRDRALNPGRDCYL